MPVELSWRVTPLVFWTEVSPFICPHCWSPDVGMGQERSGCRTRHCWPEILQLRLKTVFSSLPLHLCVRPFQNPWADVCPLKHLSALERQKKSRKQLEQLFNPRWKWSANRWLRFWRNLMSNAIMQPTEQFLWGYLPNAQPWQTSCSLVLLLNLFGVSILVSLTYVFSLIRS